MQRWVIPVPKIIPQRNNRDVYEVIKPILDFTRRHDVRHLHMRLSRGMSRDFIYRFVENHIAHIAQ